MDDALAGGDARRVHDHLGAGERCADGQQPSGLVGPDHIAGGVPRQRLVVELGDQPQGDRGSKWLAQRSLERTRQFARPGAGARPDDEDVEHGAVRPRCNRCVDDVETPRRQHVGEVREEGIGVAAGNVDLPMVGLGFGADGDSNGSRPG